MPGYVTDITNHKGKKVARATLRTPGRWEDLEQWEKDAWNRATRAIDALLDLVRHRKR